LEELSDYCKAHGFTYLGITDHSRSAYYANGLSVDRVYQQIDLIDSLNKSTSGFYIFKGIESDILNDGSLDYPEDVLQQFDFIIASIHSNLRMSEDQATSRLIKAIENPYTRILGHPTGRLLLSRKGYQPNLVKVIDAACQNKVAIELNANPLRLDLDYTWIPYAVDKGLMLSINSDAHNLKSIHDIRWGVYAANKGALPKEMCLTCLEKEAVLNFFRER